MLTRADVEQYLATHSLLPRRAVVVGTPPTPPTVMRIELMTCGVAAALLRTSIGGTPDLSEDAPVWYVEAEGAIMVIPPGFHRTNRTTNQAQRERAAKYNVAFLVLDAETGQLLLSGVRPGHPESPASTTPSGRD